MRRPIKLINVLIKTEYGEYNIQCNGIGLGCVSDNVNDELFEYVLRSASEKIKLDKIGLRDIALFKQGVILIREGNHEK